MKSLWLDMSAHGPPRGVYRGKTKKIQENIPSDQTQLEFLWGFYWRRSHSSSWYSLCQFFLCSWWTGGWNRTDRSPLDSWWTYELVEYLQAYILGQVYSPIAVYQISKLLPNPTFLTSARLWSKFPGDQKLWRLTITTIITCLEPPIGGNTSATIGNLTVDVLDVR